MYGRFWVFTEVLTGRQFVNEVFVISSVTLRPQIWTYTLCGKV